VKPPPFLPTWLLKRLGCSANNEAVLGDLAERYQAGKPAAWYWKQTLTAILLGAFEDLRTHKLLTLRAVFGAALVGACMEAFVSRNLESLTYWLPVGWWHSEAFRACIEILISISVAVLNGCLGGWTAVRLYRRRTAVLLLYIFVIQISFVIATIAGGSVMPGPYFAGLVVADACVIVGAVAGGLRAAALTRQTEYGRRV
jgi:hypothetical protein